MLLAASSASRREPMTISSGMAAHSLDLSRGRSTQMSARAGKRPRVEAASRCISSNFRLFSHLQGIVHLNSEVSDRAFELGMPEK